MKKLIFWVLMVSLGLGFFACTDGEWSDPRLKEDGRFDSFAIGLMKDDVKDEDYKLKPTVDLVLQFDKELFEDYFDMRRFFYNGFHPNDFNFFHKGYSRGDRFEFLENNVFYQKANSFVREGCENFSAKFIIREAIKKNRPASMLTGYASWFSQYEIDVFINNIPEPLLPETVNPYPSNWSRHMIQDSHNEGLYHKIANEYNDVLEKYEIRIHARLENNPLIAFGAKYNNQRLTPRKLDALLGLLSQYFYPTVEDAADIFISGASLIYAHTVLKLAKRYHITIRGKGIGFLKSRNFSIDEIEKSMRLKSALDQFENGIF